MVRHYGLLNSSDSSLVCCGTKNFTRQFPGREKNFRFRLTRQRFNLKMQIGTYWKNKQNFCLFFLFFAKKVSKLNISTCMKYLPRKVWHSQTSLQSFIFPLKIERQKPSCCFCWARITPGVFLVYYSWAHCLLSLCTQFVPSVREMERGSVDLSY